MRLQLRGAKVTPEQQKANDEHRPWVVVAVVAMLFVYAYLFTPLGSLLHMRTPADLAGSLGRFLRFEENGSLVCRLGITLGSMIRGDYELLTLFSVLAAAFLCAYFAPLRYKRPSTACWFLVAFLAFYGLYPTLLLLAAHMAVYLTFHPKARESRYLSAVLGALVSLVVLHGSNVSEGLQLIALAAAAGASFAVYAYVLIPLLRKRRFASVSRTVVIQTPLIFAFSGAIFEGLEHREWVLPLGLLFIFWQWERLMVYHADHRAGDVPEDLFFLDYLSVFMTPGILSNWQSAPYVGQAYTYLSSKFLCENKNKIVISGLRLWGVALLYFVFEDRLVREAVVSMNYLFGVTVYTSTTRLVQYYLEGTRISTPTVLLSTLLDQARIFLVFGALTHFRIGAWRVLGHDVDPQYNRPWMATNLVALWGRFAFHYREFLVRTFYYPVFFRFFKKNLYLRVFVATMIATSIGNHIWGHVPDRVRPRGVTWDNLILMLRAWPYYLLLGLGISLTQLYLMRKGRTRRPWTLDWRIGLDIIAAYCTLQYFCIIHIFARPQPDGTLMDLIRLFLIGFGIHV